ncbi:MAG: hypothetical protein ACT4P6_07440 [Gemmatimonadaceae bacterium]
MLALAFALLVARLLSASYGAFYEGDESSIAAGVAGITRDNAAHLYRYGPQVGYYRVVQGITAVVGGGVMTIPVVMVTLSVLAGTLIPLLGLFSFRADLTKIERWLLAGTLAASPVIWTSSAYGNTALPAAALVVAAVVLLSNRPATRGEVAALMLFGAAILVRADAVLATGAIGVLLWRNHASLRAAVTRVGAVALALAAIYAALFAWDPYMVQIFGDVARHLTTPDRTRFFELLIWAISPFPLVYAILGLREMEASRRWLLALITAWCIPSMGFYFASTTTPRYFILPAFAVAIASAVGMAAIARLGRRPALAWAIVLVTATLHLFVGLSNFYPNVRRSWLTDARVNSHDGDVLAGAFLYDSYVLRPVQRAGVFQPMSRSRKPAERSYVTATSRLRSGQHRGERITLVFAGGDGHGIHFFVQNADATVVDKQRSYRPTDPVTYDVGGARLTAIGIYKLDEPEALPLAVAPGDVVWLLNRSPGSAPDTEARVIERLPPGLTLTKRERMHDAPMLWTYRVDRATVAVAASKPA